MTQKLLGKVINRCFTLHAANARLQKEAKSMKSAVRAASSGPGLPRQQPQKVSATAASTESANSRKLQSANELLEKRLEESDRQKAQLAKQLAAAQELNAQLSG